MHIIYIFSDHKNRGYAPGLALGRRQVSKVNTSRLWGSLLHEDLLLVLLDDLLILLFTNGHELYRFMIYIHEMMMRHLVLQQQQLLK